MSAMVTQTQHRGPGRPPAAQTADVRSALLEAARACIVELGYAAASTKDIAQRAGVNPAMINYYFGGKAALAEACFRETIEPLRQRLDAFSQAPDGGGSLMGFLRAYMATLAANPWIARIVVREVLPRNGRFREIFFSEIVGRGARLLPMAVMAAQSDGTISAKLDPRFAAVSTASLAIFPFVTEDLLKENLGIDFSDETTFAAFAEHTQHLLSLGLGAGPAANAEEAS
jgi:TetR/AcrR family transcriptional regulator